MSLSLSRGVFNALMPPGALWTPETDGGLDQLLDGMSDNSEEVRVFLESIALLRNARLTPLLSDMEKEYGLIPNDRLTEQDRRDRLLAAQTSRFGFGADYMQTKLQEAGFDVQVHINNPPVDPDIFIFEAFKCTAGNTTSVAGNTNAVAGGIGGELVVNGDLFIETPTVSTVAGSEFAVAGSSRAVAGGIFAVERELVEYTVPGDIGYWGLFFFVGGDATRDGVTDELTAIAAAEVAVERRDELRRLIIKYKPLHSWAGLIITFV